MRLRVPELLAARGITAYQMAKQSEGRISVSQAYRLCEDEGRFGFVSAEILDALCDVFGVSPGDLLEREGARTKRR
jgi:DNA-binding Xre family transcriptional regulator